MGEPEAQDPRLGTVLQERYKILARIAAGGMGTVYRGERVGLGRRVAIKFLHATFASDKEFLRRFEVEARAMSRLSHPHCVSVIDFGIADAPYMVLDFADGETLRTLLDRGPLEPRRAIALIRQVLAGLQHAHAQGIVHRDVKPANIVIDEATGTGEHARLLDFGLAKLHDANASQDHSLGSIAVGTPGYMSPEQVRGERVDGRADVYAVGLLLFECITGQRMFTADEAWEVLKMHLEKPPSRIKDVAPDIAVSPALEAAVARALAKPAELRFQSAAEFAAALDATPEGMMRTSGRLAAASAPPAVAAVSSARPALDDSAALDLLAKASTVAMPVVRPQTPTPIAELADKAPRAKEDGLPVKGGNRILGALGALVVLGGGAYGAWWWSQNGSPARPAAKPWTTSQGPSGIDRGPAQTPSAMPSRTAPRAEPEAAVIGAAADASPVDAVAAVLAADAGAGDATAVVGDAAPPSLAEAEGIPPDERAEPVPATPAEPVREEAIDPVPPAPPRVPAPRPPVTRIEEVTALIAAGKNEDAIAGLLELRRKAPKSPYVPYLLGNLYFEKKWWTDGIAAYRLAISLNRGYRTRGILIRNVIRALDSAKTRGAASSMLRGTIGDAAVAELRRAAASDKSGVVRANAASILRAMGKKVR